MSSGFNSSDLIAGLWKVIGKSRRRQFKALLFLMVVTSLAEVVSLGAVIPFIGVILSPESAGINPKIQVALVNLGLNDPENFRKIITVSFIAIVLVTGFLRLSLIRIGTKFSYETGAELGVKIYEKTLYQPYINHVLKNSSEAIDGITSKSSIAIAAIDSLLTFISSSIILIAVLAFLLILDPKITLLLLLCFGGIYLSIIAINRKMLSKNGKIIASESIYVIKSLQEGFGGIRDVIIENAQHFYASLYKKSITKLRGAQASNQFAIASPRNLIEALGMVVIALFAYFMSGGVDANPNTLPILGAMVLACQRLLPVMQQLYGAYSGLTASMPSLTQVIEFMKLTDSDENQTAVYQPMSFNDSLEINGLSFTYPKSEKIILSDISLSIRRGECVGVIGKTGCGKSTFLDLLLGLLTPSKGSIKIDGVTLSERTSRNWQKNIAHVPQSIYLADSTILENIAFGVALENIDFDKAVAAAENAQLSGFIQTLSGGYYSRVGERGVQLSGGQRQRLGIARALYKNANIVVLDEATSALDEKTESMVMEKLYGISKDKTLFIIAHRLSTLRNCSKIIEIERGKIKRIVRYQDLINTVYPTLE